MVWRSFSDTNSSAGTVASTITVSSGDSTSITISERNSRTTLPVASGRKLSSAWTNARSELARDTIWPVGSWSWRAKSSR